MTHRPHVARKYVVCGPRQLMVLKLEKLGQLLQIGVVI